MPTRGATAAVAAAEVAAAATLAAGPAHLVDLGRGVAQARTDLVDVDLEHRAPLALAGLERARLQPAGHDDPRAALERLGDVLSSLPPDVAGEEQRVAVLPLVGLTIEGARRRRDAGTTRPQHLTG